MMIGSVPVQSRCGSPAEVQEIVVGGGFGTANDACVIVWIRQLQSRRWEVCCVEAVGVNVQISPQRVQAAPAHPRDGVASAEIPAIL